jgi:hypothetical protein
MQVYCFIQKRKSDCCHGVEQKALQQKKREGRRKHRYSGNSLFSFLEYANLLGINKRSVWSLHLFRNMLRRSPIKILLNGGGSSEGLGSSSMDMAPGMGADFEQYLTGSVCWSCIVVYPGFPHSNGDITSISQQ